MEVEMRDGNRRVGEAARKFQCKCYIHTTQPVEKGKSRRGKGTDGWIRRKKEMEWRSVMCSDPSSPVTP